MRLPATLNGLIGIFGGTFDPVHIGHLRTAYELRIRLGLERVYFVPAAVPPHREQPVASPELRARMLDAALTEESGLMVDRRELERGGPSYSIDTARSFREEFPRHAICLLLGMDAFLGLPEWHDWTELLDLVNIVIARRPGALLPESGPLGEFLKTHASRDGDWARSGSIIVEDVTQLEVSATDLRASIRAGIEPRFLVPEAVWEIAVTSGCYAE
jgi:nicotinate-nucleotide adenylyltransferase